MLQENIDEKKEPPGVIPSLNGSHLTSKPIPIPIILPDNPFNHILYENGLSKILNRLTLKVHSDIEECYKLWDLFSPKESLFDLWDFRYAWHLSHPCIPFFYTIYQGKTPLAVLPLCYNEFHKRYEWFGTDWMEDNTFWMVEDKYINLILKVIPKPIELCAIESIPRDALYENVFIADEEKYIQNIQAFSSIDDYLAGLTKKHRYNLRRDVKHIESFTPRIEFVGDKNLDDFNTLVNLSLKRFEALSEPSDFTIPEKKQAFINIIKNSGIYDVKFMKAYIKNQVVAVDLIITYKNIYNPIRGGADSNTYPGLGSFMVYENFKDAIAQKFSWVDCLQTDCGGYKKRLFNARSMMKFEVKEEVK
ncbi:MAG TPA: GNAT family N-acetyltransferase [Candidatus Nitrosocosmicus sp.]|nr:GNAT family N-acetyltransferase [Candidatus Nitrosocosmicus sp.]